MWLATFTAKTNGAKPSSSTPFHRIGLRRSEILNRARSISSSKVQASILDLDGGVVVNYAYYTRNVHLFYPVRHLRDILETL